MKKVFLLLIAIFLIASFSVVFAARIAKSLSSLDLTVDVPTTGSELAKTVTGISNLATKEISITVLSKAPLEPTSEFAIWDPADGTAKAGTEYTIKVVVPVPETYTVASTFKATVNGEAAQYTCVNRLLTVTYKFSATATGTFTRPTTGSTVTRPSTGTVTRPSTGTVTRPSTASTSTSITKVEFKIPELKDGGTQFKAEDIEVTDGIAITAMSWTNQTGGAFMTTNEKYREGYKYSVRMYFAATDGYTIADNPQVLVNGEEIEEINMSDNSGRFIADKEFTIEKPATAEIKDYVSKVEFTIPELVAGNPIIEEKDIKISGANFAGFTWANNSTHVTMTSTDKYEEGISYTLRMFFKAEDGYGFKDLKVIVNGEEVTPIEVEAPTHYKFEKVFEVKKEAATEPEETVPEETLPEIKPPVLSTIDFTVDVPIVGKNLPKKYTVVTNLVDKATVYEVGVKAEDTLGEWSPADKEVKAGSKYTFKLTIELKNSMAEISKDLKITVNKQEVKPTIKNGVYTLEYTFETEEEEEEEPAKDEMYNQFAFEITAPKIGEKPATTAKAKSDNYKVTKVEWLTKDTKFVEGETYTVDIHFEMINKNIRSDYFATVNGLGADLPDGDKNYEKNTMYAEFTFPTLRDTSKKATWSNASSWALEELASAANAGLIPTVLDKQDLKLNVTRREFAHIAVRLYELISGKGIRVTSAPFKDTDDPEIAKAYTVEITKGISDTEFAPDQEISREQMSTMMARALEKARVDTFVDLTKVKEFSDDKDMHNWSRSAIYFMSNVDIIKGMGDGNFGVKNNASREQSLLIAIRSAEKFATKK